MMERWLRVPVVLRRLAVVPLSIAGDDSERDSVVDRLLRLAQILVTCVDRALIGALCRYLRTPLQEGKDRIE